jgi:hypothetical protein
MHSFSCLASTLFFPDSDAIFQNGRASFAVDGAIHAAPAKEGAVGCVYYCVYL